MFTDNQLQWDNHRHKTRIEENQNNLSKQSLL